MTFSELDREAADCGRRGRCDDKQAAMRGHFIVRFALSVASIVLAGFLLATSVRRRVMRVFTALLACFAYWALIFVGEGARGLQSRRTRIRGHGGTIALPYCPAAVAARISRFDPAEAVITTA